MRIFFFLVFTVVLPGMTEAQQWRGAGSVSFISDAPLEKITASSEELRGIIDMEKRTFAFTFPVSTFEGFNSPLQKEHFNEHYLETKEFPNATFTGVLIGTEEICAGECELEMYAKGKMTIHGITVLMTIPVRIEVKPSEWRASGEFYVALSDHGIGIPKILEAKIATEIAVSVAVMFKP